MGSWWSQKVCSASRYCSFFVFFSSLLCLEEVLIEVEKDYVGLVIEKMCTYMPFVPMTEMLNCMWLCSIDFTLLECSICCGRVHLTDVWRESQSHIYENMNISASRKGMLISTKDKDALKVQMVFTCLARSLLGLRVRHSLVYKIDPHRMYTFAYERIDMDLYVCLRLLMYWWLLCPVRACDRNEGNCLRF